jgi:hypothetical protein
MDLNTLSQSEWFTTYLEYENLKEMLNVWHPTSSDKNPLPKSFAGAATPT